MTQTFLEPIAALSDNYIWLLHDGRHAVVVDPAEAAPVRAALAARGLNLAALLVTHHHADHTGGVPALRAEYEVPAYGPAAEDIACLTHRLREGEVVEIPQLGLKLAVWEIPGHTRGHLAYVGADFAFCGDTLFSAGCGRLFEGTPAQMYASLQRLAALPETTRVCCAHEYTLANLRFAAVVEPDNADRIAYQGRCEAKRAAGEPTLPSTIGLERAVNPFLRVHTPTVAAAIAQHYGYCPADPVERFRLLRQWKDGFRG
ncbi:hydroxyacylglutathione hydrolase [Tepidiphilus sp. HLB4]